MDGDGRRSRVEPNNDWEQLALLCRWPEQLAYREIHPLTPMRLEGYAPRSPRRPEGLQQALFAYHEAWGRLLSVDLATF